MPQEGHAAGEPLAAPATRSPRDIIQLYWEEVWNKGDVELIREICADPIVRHDVGSVTLLSHDEQVARVRRQVERYRPHFTHEVLNADDAHVTSVWNSTSSGEDGAVIEICGIETFRAENGRFTDCWNSPYAKGRWGRLGNPSVAEALPPPGFIAAAEAIDADWLQRMFKAAGVDVPRVAMVHRVEPVGNGTTSNVSRVHFGYNADEGESPVTLIAKLPGDRARGPSDGPDFIGYTREVEAYRFFGAERTFRIPRSFLAELDAGGGFNLVLQDLGGTIFRAGDQIRGCGIAEAFAVIDELAGLHARYWLDPVLETLSWPVRPSERAAPLRELFARGAALIRSRYADALGPEVFGLIDAAMPLVEPWLLQRPRHVSLIHGDPRVDNIVFEDLSDGGVNAYLIDLQQVAIGDPLSDLAYFLTGSLEPEDRATCERQLVDRHSAVMQAVDPSYDPRLAWDRYRANAISGLVSTVSAAAIITLDGRTDGLIVALARRNCAAIAALDGIEAVRAATMAAAADPIETAPA